MSAQPARAVCPYCRRPVFIRTDGQLARHDVRLPISAKAVTTVGSGSVQRRCSGSGKPPKAERAGKA